MLPHLDGVVVSEVTGAGDGVVLHAAVRSAEQCCPACATASGRVLVHCYAGRSQHELAASLGVDRKTIRKYVAPALAAGIVAGGPARGQDQWAELVRGWFPELVDTRLRQVTWPAIEVHRDYVAAQMQAGVTAATIHQRLRDEQGLAASVASFRRWVRATPWPTSPAATPTAPGPSG